jgi:mono/diheme cytochrome c family protein
MPGAAAAGDGKDPDTGAGAQLYRSYCASCHGVEGRGKGPVAPSLVVAPADLTRLAEKYGDPLPLDRLAEFIDGRKEITAHGPREMPVWGEEFYPEGRPGNPKLERARRGTIMMILHYLSSIQTLRGASVPSPTPAG